MNFAAIDCGTNSTRLLIGDGTTTHVREMHITRLGAGVNATGRLAADAIDRTLGVLRLYREAMDRYLEELTRQALEQMRNMPPDMRMQPIDPSQMVDRQSLQEMIDRAEEMMQSGAREQAQAIRERWYEGCKVLGAGDAEPFHPCGPD